MTSIQQVLDPLSGPHRPRNRRRNPLWRFRRFFFVLALFGLGAIGAVLYAFSQTELPEDAFEEIAQTSFLCTAEVTANCGPDNATALLASPGEDREVVTFDQLSENIIDAVVATEDQDFFVHRGVDPRGITRAAYQYVRGTGVLQGGSTITQQYVKLAFNDADQSIERKMREAMRAIKLEQDLSSACADQPDLGDKDPRQCAKEEILTRYLNRAYFGRGASGVQAAARSYFGKDVAQLSIAESAFLAGLLRNPNGADPDSNLGEATRRRDLSIGLMLDSGLITADEATAALAEPWNVVPRRNREGLGEVKGAEFGTEYFVEEVRLQVEEIFTEGELYTDGLRVYTTLRQDMQQAAYETVYVPREEDLEARGFPDMGPTWLDPASPLDPEAAMVTVDSQGRVLAMLGGYDFDQSQFNLATSSGTAGRQAGSTFKVFALAEAIRQGISAKSFYPAAPGPARIGGRCADADGPWTPSGGSNPQTRYRDLIDALTVSSNIVFAELVVDIGPDQLRDLARQVGIRSPLQPPAPDGGTSTTPCSLVLGSEGVPVIDMASAYSTFERAGVRLDPVLIERVEDADGNVLCWYPVDGECAPGPERVGEQVLDPVIARQVNYAMTQVVAKGTGRRAALADRPTAGKTGTTQESADAWFAGFACDLTTAVWMGFPDAQRPMYDFRKPLPDDPDVPVNEFGVPVNGDGQPIDDRNWRNIEGGNFPSFLWNDYMERVTADLMPCSEIEVETEFPGTRLNQDLSTTTLPPCGVELDQYGFPRGSGPDDFVLTPTTVPPQPTPAQPDNEQAQGLPRQGDDAGPTATNCIPLDQWAGQSTVTGPTSTTLPEPTTTLPDDSTTVTTGPGTSSTATTTDPSTTTTAVGAPSTVSVPPGTDTISVPGTSTTVARIDD